MDVYQPTNPGISPTILDAKGDLITATAADTPARLAVGNNGELLVAASGQATGLQWQSASTAGLATLNASINAQVGTAYTLQASDNGKIVTLDNGSAITVTVPSGLGAGFNCILIQLGAGLVSFTASGTTLNNRQSFVDSAGQYAMMSLAAYAANTFALGGDLA